MSKTYSDWLGRQVVLQIKAGESLVPLRGLVVHESNNALRFRLDGRWEVDIYKEMILRVEADNYEAFQLRNWGADTQAPGAARSDSMPMISRNRVFDRWWSKHFFVAIVVEDHHLRRIGWKCPVCSGPGHECAGTHHSFCPLHLRLSRTGVLRGISGLWSVGAHRVAYLRQVVETLCVIS